MPDLRILDQLIKPAARVPLTIERGRASVKLVESQMPNSCVTIAGLPADALVVKADKFQAPDTIFCGTKGECKRADYVIIANTGAKKRILFIEMKKTKGSREDIIKQLSGSRCFVDYCQQIGKVFWKETNFLDDYQYRFVSFGHTGIPKKRTQIERTAEINDSPEKMMKVAWPNRQEFNHLVGR
ncbi:MAG: hypothetical protein A4E61_01377 [Syntrophorhabdus sp. PtaB.Bin184]|jgi:hypothetical protein|nr:MAG: hypothetical protein A4E61_01377 [Syntrophorhabdus sp. PtaB.Bin184]